MVVEPKDFGRSVAAPARDTATPRLSPQIGTKVPSGFRPDIEGLRAVAVLAVVLFHAGIPGFRGGFVGVDVFFVISGFLISGMLWREVGTSGKVSLRRFWGARARRLLPASALVGVVTIAASAFILSPLQVKTVAVDAITSALYVSNYWFIFSGVNYFGKDSLTTPTPFQHYWSLGVEEQFYLVWPVLIIATAWFLRRVRRRGGRDASTPAPAPYVTVLALVAVVSFALSLVLTFIMPPAAYLSLPTRAWQLAAGGLVALTVVHWQRLGRVPATVIGWTGLGTLLFACVWVKGSSDYPGVLALLPTLGTALVIGAGCAHAEQGCGRLLGLAPMRSIGRISYSWYLWHWPVLVLIPALLGHPVGLVTRLAAMAFSAVLAVLTWKFVENPLRFSARFRGSPRNSLVLGAAVTAIAVAAGAITLVGTPAPVGPGPAARPLVIAAEPTPPGLPLQVYDTAVRNVFAQVNEQVTASVGMTAVPSNLSPPLTGTAAEVKSIVANGCLRSLPFDGSQPECLSGNRSSETTIALIGDSHAAMWNPAFRRAVDDRNWRMLLMAKASCPIVDLPLTDHLNEMSEGLQRCAQWRSGIMARLRADPPQLVVVSAVRSYGAHGTAVWGKPGFDPFNPAWIDGLGDLVHELRSYGSKVLVLGPEPKLASVATNCLSAHLEDAKACEVPWRATNNAGIEAESSMVRGNGGDYANTVDLFCSGDRCPPVVGNTMVFYDASHLTKEYSQALGPAVGALIDRSLAHD
ncbi:acyltransferase family protein [Mycobacterium hackensackense]|uniref:acyltransferase family protein n=1 Tax=Mycobacterium hackensackense TaxID=228909 RepID=UPI002265E0B9|nr:acyltransferase family protein [Mycobacterium hackensackense]